MILEDPTLFSDPKSENRCEECGTIIPIGYEICDWCKKQYEEDNL